MTKLHIPPTVPMPVEPDFGEPVVPVGDPPQIPVKVTFPELDTTDAA